MSSVVLLSGGLDSATTLAIALQNDEAAGLTFDYGQSHSREVDSARRIARHFDIQHVVMDFPLEVLRSALTDDRIKIPMGGVVPDVIPDTYVPARNIVFLSIALGLAEAEGARAVYIGANAIDYSGYPDCRPEFFEAFSRVVESGTRAGVEGRPITIETPIIGMTKSEIIAKGIELGVPFGLTWSCYTGSDKACGKCDSCRLRLKGFDEAGIPDPIEYQHD